MWIRTGLIVAGTLSLTSTIFALHAEPVSFVKFSVASSVSSKDGAAVDRNRELSERKHHGREIVEITDPTTDSTLHLPQYPIDCTNNKECDLIGTDTTPMPTFRPYTQEELNGFLKKYVENNRQVPRAEQPTNKLANLYMEETVNVLEGGDESEKSQEKSKSWQLMQASPHKSSYDDKTGWVTLEPVPWSASQIQKWEPNKRPPGIPQWNEDPPQTSWDRPAPNKYDKPWNNKNSYVYKPQNRPWGGEKYGSRPSGWNSDSQGSGSEIITGDGPSQFPHDSARPAWYERPQTEVVYHGEKEGYNHPQNYPSDGDGRWVLLSSTKGYSVPHRSRAHQRSLFITANTPSPNGSPSVKSHRSVRLTVLPPLNGTMNTTTIHNGMVEVEQTQQTVEEAHREHLAKMLKLDKLSPAAHSQSHAPIWQTASPSTAPVATRRSGASIKVYPVRSSNVQARNNAMLAAVGAGMIPATVAMMLPMVLGRRRRRRSIEVIPIDALHPIFPHQDDFHGQIHHHFLH